MGGSEFVDKPVMLLNASSRSTYAQASLIETLKTMSGNVISEASIAIDLMGKHLDETGILGNLEMSAVLKNALDIFTKIIQQHEASGVGV